MSIETQFEKLIIQHPDGKQTGAIPCFELCFFYVSPRKVAKTGYYKLLSFFVERYALNLKWFITNTMKQCKRIDGSALDQLNSFLLNTEFEKDGDLGIEQHSGPTAKDFCPPSLNIFSEQLKEPKGGSINRTFIRLCLPYTKASDPRGLLDLATTCATAQPLYCGHAGFSWYWNNGDTILEEEIGSKKGFLLRHPCMGESNPFTYLFLIGEGLVQVGWLTFLGTTLTDDIGDLSKIRDKLPDSVDLVDLGKQYGIIFTAGERPILGSNDPKHSGFLAPYRAVGQATKAVRLKDSALEYIDIPGFEDEEEIRKWYLRFFGEE